jgi:hypothetical protein
MIVGADKKGLWDCEWNGMSTAHYSHMISAHHDS